MHGGGVPGGSLRAYRDYLPNAKIYGAGIDASILFPEDRINTFVVDQLDPEPLNSVGEKIESSFAR